MNYKKELAMTLIGLLIVLLFNMANSLASHNTVWIVLNAIGVLCLVIRLIALIQEK